MAYIYSIYNTATNKSYIGQTQWHYMVRFRKHLSMLRNQTHTNTYLQNTYNKYGEKSFKCILLTECQITELDFLERQYIALFKTTDSNYGYNICTGGSGVKSKESQIKNKISNQQNWPNVLKICPNTYKITKIYPSQGAAAREEKVGLSNIHNSCKDRGRIVKGFYYVLEIDYNENWKPHLDTRSHPYAIIVDNQIKQIVKGKKELSQMIQKGLPTINKLVAEVKAFEYENEQCYLRPLSHEEYYKFNIGTCIDYPREEE